MNGTGMNAHMESEFDSTLRRLTAEQVASAPGLPPFDDVRQRTAERISIDTRHVDVRRRVVVAAAGIVALVGGLAIVSLNNGDPASVATVDSLSVLDPGQGSVEEAVGDGVGPVDVIALDAGRPLADVAQLGRDEWVIPTVMVGGYNFQYASTEMGFQTAMFGAGLSMERVIRIGIFNDMQMTSQSTEELVIAGQDWTVERSDGFWHGTSRVGSAFVSVGGPDLDDAHATAIIESLRAVTPAEMAIPPLGSLADQVVVATFEGEQDTVTMSASGVNNWYSISTQNSNGSGGSSGAEPFDPVDVITLSGGGFSYGDGATVIDASATGIVGADVDRVEVEFLDGSVVSVIPTDLSGEFDVKFYVVVAEVDLEGRSPDLITSVVTESRAFDAVGELIGSQRPGGEFFSNETSVPPTTMP